MAQYRIEPDDSEVFVEVHSNVHPIEIHIQGLVGTIDADVQSGDLDLAISPRASLQLPAELLRSGIELYDNEIHRMIEVSKYRTIRGELSQVTEISKGRYRLRGSLLLHGVTRDVEGEVRVQVREDGRVLEIEGEHTLDMRDFDLDPPKILMLEVQPDVRVHATLRARRSG